MDKFGSSALMPHCGHLVLMPNNADERQWSLMDALRFTRGRSESAFTCSAAGNEAAGNGA